MEKLTLHRALTELKTLNCRISDATSSLSSSIGLVKTKLQKPAGFDSDETFLDFAEKQYQSVLDLISRRDMLKRSVVLKNATTNVTIAGQTMTIAEAIELKNSISLLESLTSNVRYQYNRLCESANRANSTLIASLSPSIGEKSANVEASKELYELELQKKTQHVLFSKKILEKNSEKEKFVEQFKLDVDVILSEVNASTFIEL